MVHSNRVHRSHQQPDDCDRDSITDKGRHEPYYELKSTERLVIKLLRHERYAPHSTYSVGKQRRAFTNL